MKPVTTGTLLRDTALSQQNENSPATTAQFLAEIVATRKCRLRMAKTHDEVFTIEQLLQDIQTRCKLPAGTNLYGMIGRLARQRDLIEETGNWTEANRESRHAGRVPVCFWLPDIMPPRSN